jgi:hypothetical protein
VPPRTIPVDAQEQVTEDPDKCKNKSSIPLQSGIEEQLEGSRFLPTLSLDKLTSSYGYFHFNVLEEPTLTCRLVMWFNTGWHLLNIRKKGLEPRNNVFKCRI